MSYTFVKQHDMTDCAAACISMISKHHGLKLSIMKIRQAATTDKISDKMTYIYMLLSIITVILISHILSKLLKLKNRNSSPRAKIIALILLFLIIIWKLQKNF